MLQYVNTRERCHIVTIEDPIEFTFKDDKCIINQREVGIDVVNWDTALKHAVRQDPDIILVGEMRDRETFNAAMHAAETGHLVFGTIHASTAPSTISRILDLFPQDMHNAMRQNLAFNLKAIVAQKLLPTTKDWAAATGQTRAPLVEVMRMNPTVKKLILNEEDIKLAQAIRLGKEEGMVDFTESLRQLVVAEKVERAVAFENAPNPELASNGAQRHHSSRARHSVMPALPRVASLPRKVRNVPPVPGVPGILRSDRGCRHGLAGGRAFLGFRHPGPGAAHDARAGNVPESVQVHPGRDHLPALGVDDELGGTRHQRACQSQVRRLEQRGLLFRRAGAGARAGHPDLFHRAGAVAAGVFRSAALVHLCPQSDGARRPESADAVPSWAKLPTTSCTSWE